MTPKFHERVRLWFRTCFPNKSMGDVSIRNSRFLEEALELVQATGFTREQALQSVNYVYDRNPGIPKQEVGGVVTTLSLLCSALKLDMEQCAEVELSRMFDRIESIRIKEAAKPSILVVGVKSE